jgi:DNA-binding LacI/PurR family transcriptional regulator
MKKQIKHALNRPITALDVAKLAGVSQSAVSRFFTPNTSISEKTRLKVKTAADQLQYRPNAIARSLITSRSKIIALVLGYFANPFYALALAKLCQKLSALGYGVLVFETDGRDSEPQVEQMLSYRVDGVLLLSANLTSKLASRLGQNGIPTVLMNRRDLHGPNPSVIADNHKGGAEIARYLSSKGRRRFAYVAGLKNSSTNRDRQRGFTMALKQLGHNPPLVVNGEYEPDVACEAIREIFKDKGPKPDALFVANDHMACAVLDTLRFELKLKVPKDIAVVGFDDAPPAAWPSYSLTTYSQPVDLMVDESISLLIDRIENPQKLFRTRTVPGELIIRASA